jgi:hypothetical protein
VSKQGVIRAFRELVEPDLRTRGFTGRRGHLIRRIGPVAQVVELQHSIYGGRITANLGLDLEFLKPIVRWIDRPSIGPHAHDSTRWVRVGLVQPDPRDLWWAFDDDTDEGCEEAARGLGRAILDHGISWLEAESDPAAFLRYADVRLERSRSVLHPQGCYMELRLMAAVLAWNGEIAKARVFAERARLCWDEERARLAEARAQYRRRHTSVTGRLPQVPDVQGELDDLISTTTASGAEGSSSRPKRSRSARMRSSPS